MRIKFWLSAPSISSSAAIGNHGTRVKFIQIDEKGSERTLHWFAIEERKLVEIGKGMSCCSFLLLDDELTSGLDS